MGATAFSKGQFQALSAKTGAGSAAAMSLINCQLSVRRPQINMSSATGATNVVEFANGLPINDYTCMQVDSSLGLAQLSTLAFDTMDDTTKLVDWTIGKRWTLGDLTGSGDDEKEWHWGNPILYGYIRAWAKGDVNHALATSALTGTYNVYGTSTAAVCNITGLTIMGNKGRGGAMPVAIHFNATGVIDGTGDIFAAAIVNPPEGTLTMTNSGGPAYTFNALCYDTYLRSNAEMGGPINVFRRFRSNKAA